MAVWDNTRTKDILNQDNPELCERIARSIGTRQERELTVRQKEGPLLTSLATRDTSWRTVEAEMLELPVPHVLLTSRNSVAADSFRQAQHDGPGPAL